MEKNGWRGKKLELWAVYLYLSEDIFSASGGNQYNFNYIYLSNGLHVGALTWTVCVSLS